MGDQQDSLQIPHKQTTTHHYDAIVVGSGISGGWAAMELCKKGIKTLLLERGRNVEHIKDYPTAMLKPWEFPGRLVLTSRDREENPIQSLVYNEGSRHFYVKDKDHPYIQVKPFNWIRGYQVGGRSLVWGRQTYRLSDLDFTANSKDGHGVDWPLRYKDIAPWYDYVEEFVGISGRKEGLPHLPDGIFLPQIDLNCIEEYLAQSVSKNFPGRLITPARIANLSRGWKGRGPCMYRNLCDRGCPFGGYFSSNSSTIPVAMDTGNLTLRPHSIVYEIIYDDTKQRATGVRVVDELTKETTDFFGRIIFLNASTIGTTSIMLNSKSSRFPNGFGNDSNVLGKYLLDHHSGAGASGEYDGFKDKYYAGRKPAGFYIPRFQNLDEKTKENQFIRGYGFQGDGERKEWQDMMLQGKGFGKEFKEQLTTPGPWSIWMAAWGECLPNKENEIKLDNNEKDKWGLPLVRVKFEFSSNEKNMRIHARQHAAEMLKKAGFHSIETFDYNFTGGTTVHEMGTARMGLDPNSSVLNGFNQVHACKNVFVTDGSCMPSGGCQNPSLTYMALTARAVAFAANEMQKGNL